MKIIILLFLSAIASVLAYNWQNGGAGVIWGQDCDFRWGDIYTKPSSAAQCGPICVSDGRCTHFTWFRGTCWVKDFNGKNDFVIAHGLPGGVCGWINRNG